MLQHADFYPTRNESEQPIIPRQEPVIHSTGSQRTEGPLGKSQLDQFDRDGFLWFNGFFQPEEVDSFLGELVTMARDPEMRDREEVVMDKGREEIRSVFAMHQFSEAFDRMTREHWPEGPAFARLDAPPRPSWLGRDDVRPITKPRELREILAALAEKKGDA